MKKRLLSVVLAFTLCFGMMPVTVLAEEMGNAETVALALDDQVVVRAVNSTHEEDAVGDTVSGDSIIPGGVSATSLMSNDGITVVADDATGTVVAKLGDQIIRIWQQRWRTGRRMVVCWRYKVRMPATIFLQ